MSKASAKSISEALEAIDIERRKPVIAYPPNFYESVRLEMTGRHDFSGMSSTIDIPFTHPISKRIVGKTIDQWVPTKEVNLEEIHFVDCVFTDITDLKVSLKKVIFENCTFRYISLNPDTNSEHFMREVVFIDCVFEDAYINGSSPNNPLITNCLFNNCFFGNVQLSDIRVTNCSFDCCRFNVTVKGEESLIGWLNLNFCKGRLIFRGIKDISQIFSNRSGIEYFIENTELEFFVASLDYNKINLTNVETYCIVGRGGVLALNADNSTISHSEFNGTSVELDLHNSNLRKNNFKNGCITAGIIEKSTLSKNSMRSQDISKLGIKETKITDLDVENSEISFVSVDKGALINIGLKETKITDSEMKDSKVENFSLNGKPFNPEKGNASVGDVKRLEKWI